MNKYLFVLLIGTAGSVQAQCLCSAAWFQSIDKKLQTADAQGHGPDIGSEEWKSVIEFKLGVRGRPNVPDRRTDAWCKYIDQHTKGLRHLDADSPST